MKWYEKKFSDFFNKWTKGDLFLKNSKGYFGEVDSIEFSDRFEDSTIRFTCYEDSNREKTFPLDEIRHFHAYNGPILNIGKYVNIVKIEEKNYLSVVDNEKKAASEAQEREEADKAQEPLKARIKVVEQPKEEGNEDKVICMAFGLEFYTNEKTAEVLRRDIKRMLFSKLEGGSLLSIDDRSVINLTPTFSGMWSRLFGGLGSHRGKHAKLRKGKRELPQDVEENHYIQKEVKR